MTPPYKFRIVCAMPGGPDVELFRANRAYAQADWSFWTRDLSPEWERWTEFTLADKDCITRRPLTRAPHIAVVSAKNQLHLTDCERFALEEVT